MRKWKWTTIGLVAAMLTVPALAQETEEELEERMREAESRLTEQEQRELDAASEVLAREAEEMARLSQVESVEAEVRMRAAERRMAEAARQVADLSMRQLPRVERIERVFRASQGPVLGITIGGSGDDPVEGVDVLGVTPGGAAAEAGLRAGDVITSINEEPLAADTAEAATEKLLDFMRGVENGDELNVEYLRDGKSASVELTARPIVNAFAFEFDAEDFDGPNFDVHVAPKIGRMENFVWAMHDDGFGDMEMVKLSERLGSYFGTDEGLLVVRAPGNEELKLEDGDVILNIDGREPQSVSHALRILGSYQAGEELKIEIMRDKRKQRIEVVMPDNRQSWVQPSAAPLPPSAPRQPTPAMAPRAVIVTGEERT